MTRYGWSEPRPLKHRYRCAVCGRAVTPDQVAMVHTDGRIIHAGCVPAEAAS